MIIYMDSLQKWTWNLFSALIILFGDNWWKLWTWHSNINMVVVVIEKGFDFGPFVHERSFFSLLPHFVNFNVIHHLVRVKQFEMIKLFTKINTDTRPAACCDTLPGMWHQLPHSKLKQFQIFTDIHSLEYLNVGILLNHTDYLAKYV